MDKIKSILSKGRKNLPAIILFFTIIIIWEVLIIILETPTYILPKPSEIFVTLQEEFNYLLYNLGITMLAAISGLLLGSFLAFFAAITFMYSEILERAIYPWAIIVRSIPVVAIAPLLTIWLGYGMAPKITIAAIICFFPILVNTTKGLKSTDQQAIELMQLLGASKKEILLKLRLPNSLPYIFAAYKISGTVAVVGAIVAEFTGSDAGIGAVIISAGYRMDSTMLFASIVVAAIASILMFYLMVTIEKISIYWPQDKGEE